MTDKTSPTDESKTTALVAESQPSVSGPSLERLGWSPFFQAQLEPTFTRRDRLARIMAHNGQEITLLGPSGDRRLQLQGKHTKGEREDRPTVGDWVLLNESQSSLQKIFDRKSLFKRKLPSDANAVQLIAANIDTLFIVSSCNQDFNLSRLERYLALAHEAEVMPVLLLTKADLCDIPERYRVEAAKLGADLPVELLNAKDPQAADPLRKWCGTGQTVALMGSSGTGKSTLINSLLGEDRQATGAIREDDAKGRHTTTHRSLHLLDQGGLLLDSPGIRELNLTEISDGLLQAFSDVSELMAACRFTRCSHQEEPGCAVQAALADGSLEPRRWENFQKLQQELTLEAEKTSQRRDRKTGFGKARHPGSKSGGKGKGGKRRR
ncbi:ribosome small subunit-dependent GTPase A [Rhodovibrionaceae bacterium A322]